MTPVEKLPIYYPNFHERKMDMKFSSLQIWKRKQEGKAERNRCYPKGSGGIWLFWSLYQQLPHPQEKPSSCWTTRFSGQSTPERWTPLLQQQVPENKPNVSVNKQFSYQVKHFSWRRLSAAVDFKLTNFHKYFLSTYHAPGTVLGWHWGIVIKPLEALTSCTYIPKRY